MINDTLLDGLNDRQKEAVMASWGLSERDYKDLIFDMYCVLVSKHCTCGFLKRLFLYCVGIWKFYIGGKV